MKYFLIFCILILSEISLGQNKNSYYPIDDKNNSFGISYINLDNSVNYYPLGVGYKWYYAQKESYYGIYGNYVNVKRDIWYIDKDTLIQNKNYFIFHQGERIAYQRVDTVELKVYEFDLIKNNEFAIFDLALEYSDTFNNIPFSISSNDVRVSLSDFDISSKFNLSTNYKRYNIDNSFWRTMTLDKFFGMDSIYMALTTGNERFSLILEGMVKDGQVFGDTNIVGENYFPLAIGNQWFYKVEKTTFLNPGITKDTYIKKWFIEKDTVINNKKYFVFNQDDHILYMRYDVNSYQVYQLNPYNEEVLSFLPNYIGNHQSVTLPIYNGEISYPYESDRYLISVFNEIKPSKKYSFNSLFWSYASIVKDYGYDTLKADSDEFADYVYSLEAAIIDNVLYGDTLNLSVEDNEVPSTYVLFQNFPNPFNPTTTICFSIPNSGLVKLSVYDVLGNEIAILVNEEKAAGTYRTNFNGQNVSSGIYFYKISTNDFTSTNKMILIK